MITDTIDVAVIGGGPAGISTCLELSKRSRLNIALFESLPELGGIPRICSHIFFGLRDLNRVVSGHRYAQLLERALRATDVSIHTNTTVLKVTPGGRGKSHRISVVSPAGVVTVPTRYIVLATGCYEQSRESRRIPGTRPAGVFTTGALQRHIQFQHTQPGRKAIIIGSELIAFSSLLTLKRTGVAVSAMVEEDRHLHTYVLLAKTATALLRLPIFMGTSVQEILGTDRVRGVVLTTMNSSTPVQLDCDTVIVTGELVPESALIHDTPILQDPSTGGPRIDMNMMTAVPNIFAAGNVLRGAEMHDLCALEGKRVARNIIGRHASHGHVMKSAIPLRCRAPICYVSPQHIYPEQVNGYRTSLLRPGVSIQLDRTMHHPVLEAWSGRERIWAKHYAKLTAATRIPLPIEQFDWLRVLNNGDVVLKLKG